jgi:Holliday junction resolvasome RuvABC ATP-dependent DNA helicase subunit
MAREKVIGSEGFGESDRQRDAALRPKLLREVIGQKKVAERLQIAVNAATQGTTRSHSVRWPPWPRQNDVRNRAAQRTR